MGRNITNTTNTKAIITKDVPKTFFTAYNNTTGAAAELLGININGTADDTQFTTTTGIGSDEWSYFGSNTVPVHTEGGQSSRGFGVPYPVQLSDDRVLIFFLPHWQHMGGQTDFMAGNTIHCQILEYANDRYRAGPITTHTLPSSPYTDGSYSLWSEPEGMSGSWNQPNWRAVALNANKVVASYRIRGQWRLMRFTITANAVDFAVADLDLTGATFFNNTNNYAYDLAIVPGDTDQVMVGGWASSNWSMQAFNVPNTGAMSSATALTSTGITSSSYPFGFSQMVKTATAFETPYIIGAATAGTTAQAVIMTYNSNTNTLTTTGSTVNLTNASGSWSGIQCECLSTGTNVNAVIGCMQTSTSQNMSFYRQLSGTQASNNIQTLVLQHTSTKSLSETFKWGDSRAIFTGDSQLLVTYNAQGVFNNLIPNTESTNTERGMVQWWPFNSKPLYNLYTTNSIQPQYVTQYYSRINMADAEDIGEMGFKKNYLPMGHDCGRVKAWNEAAGCWVVGYKGIIYSMDVNGNILSEKNLYEYMATRLGSTAWNWQIGALTCTPSGRILFATTRYMGSYVNSSYLTQSRCNTFDTTNYICVTDPLTDPLELNQSKLEQDPYAPSYHVPCNMTAFTEWVSDTERKERAYFFTMDENMQGRIYEFGDGTDGQWSDQSATGISTTSSNNWHEGWNPNFRLIQDTPVSQAYPAGMWRLIGSYAMNSRSNYLRRGISHPYREAQFSSMNTTQIQLSNVDDTMGYGVTLAKYDNGNRAGIQVAAMYNEQYGRMDVFQSIDGRLSYTRGWTPGNLQAGSQTNSRFAQATVSKFGYAIAFQNTSQAAKTTPVYVFNKNNIDTPQASLTTTSGHGWVSLTLNDKNKFEVYAEGIDNSYQVSGIPDTIKFFVKLNNGATDDFVLNNGQTLEIIDDTTGLFRATDQYFIPAGYNLQIRCDTEKTITTLLTIKEYI